MDLSTRINRITDHIGVIGNSKVELALELLNTKKSVYWKDTSYGSWRAFCDTEVALSQSAIYVYLKTAALAEQNKFSPHAMSLISGTIGWDRFRMGLTKIDKDEVITVATFIERYKKLNLNERVTYAEDESSLVSFTFNLPKDTAETLSKELTIYGMRETHKNRSNMSHAMVKLVKDLMSE